MKTKTLITTAALIGACSLFAATSAIAANETITGDRPTLTGDGDTKTLVDANIGTFTQTVARETILTGTATIGTATNAAAASTVRIGAGSNIDITDTFNASTAHTAAISWVRLDENSTLSVKQLNAAYGVAIRGKAGSIVNVETLDLSNGGGAGAVSLSGEVNTGVMAVFNVGTLNIRNGSDFTVNNGGRLNIGAGGIVSTGVGAGRYNIRLGWNSHIGTAESWSSNLNIKLTASPVGAFVTFDPSAGKSITLSGVVSDQGRLVKTGEGDLILTGSNTYAAGTTISAGTLVAGHNNALGTGAITVQNGGALEIATGVVLNAAKGVTLEAGSKLVIDMSAHAGVQNVVLDILTIGAGEEFKVGDTIVTSANVNTVLEGFYELTGGRWDIAWEYTNGKLSFAGAAIPEPSTFGLLAGLGALALVASRRRRSRKAA